MHPKRCAGAQCGKHEPAASEKAEVVDEARNHQDAQYGRNDAGCMRLQQTWTASPSFHPFRMNCGADIAADDGKVFPKIKAVPKFFDGLLPARDLSRSCRCLQPACE